MELKTKNIGKTFHISTKKFVSIKNLVLIIFKLLKKNKKLIRNVKERDGKDFGYYLDNSKIIKEYGWQEKTSLETGLKKTVDWIKNNYQVINKLNSYSLAYNEKVTYKNIKIILDNLNKD